MPKGRGGEEGGKEALRSWIMVRSWVGVYPRPPITPRPPARETAEARGVVDVCAMPARRIGWVIERREVRGVVRVRRGKGPISGGGGEVVGRVLDLETREVQT